MAAPRGPGAALADLIIENAREYAIFTLDDLGVIESWSPGAKTIFGYDASAAVGMHFSALFTPADLAAGAHTAELEKARLTGRAEDTRWHLRQTGERFWANGVTMAMDEPGQPSFLKIVRDETPAKAAEDQRVLLLNELNHRIKNTLTTVQAIVEQTLRARHVDASARADVTDRLKALSMAHDVLVDESWAGADLHTIIRAGIAPHQDKAARRFRVEGPPVRLRTAQAVAMALVMHELTTNALKHGALSAAEGSVTITWNIAHEAAGARHLTLLWEEAGGPSVAAPARTGFGTRLIAQTFGPNSGGSAKLDYADKGVRCVVELPLSSREETPLDL